MNVYETEAMAKAFPYWAIPDSKQELHEMVERLLEANVSFAVTMDHNCL